MARAKSLVKFISRGAAFVWTTLSASGEEVCIGGLLLYLSSLFLWVAHLAVFRALLQVSELRDHYWWAWGPYRVPWDQMWLSLVQGKCLTHCHIAAALPASLFPAGSLLAHSSAMKKETQEHLFIPSWDPAKGGGFWNPALWSPGTDDLLMEHFCNLMPLNEPASLGSSCHTGWHLGPASELRG